MREPLKIKNGAHVVVSNQWGDNINNFVDRCEDLGYKITIVKSTKATEKLPLKDLKQEKSAQKQGKNTYSSTAMELIHGKDFPNSMVKGIKDNIEDHHFIQAVDTFLREQLSHSHQYFGASKIFQYTILFTMGFSEKSFQYRIEKNYFEENWSINQDWKFNHDLAENPLVDQIIEFENIDLDKEELANFKIKYSAYFAYLIEEIAGNEDEEMLEEFLAVHLMKRICSRKRTKEGKQFGEDWLHQLVLDLMQCIYNVDLTDYESSHTISGFYFGYDSFHTIYSTDILAEELIEELAP
jgi:hypothetical protein